MSCERFKTRLLDFALGADDPEFRDHLNSCSTCRAELDAQRALLEKIDRGVATLVAGEPSGDFAAHVRRRIAEQAAAPRKWFSGWLPLTAAAAVALVVLLLVLNLGRPPREPQSAQETPPAQDSRPPKQPQLARQAPPVPAPANARGPRAIRRPHEGQMAANREPEVLVPRGEMAAVMRLYEANWNGKADGASLTASAIPTSEFLKPWITPELKIAPLEIAPLVEEGKPIGSLENR
jgi:negative regulator of sigma E activity